MGEIVNDQRNTTALVEKYIGTAYDKMAELYANLPELLELHGYFLSENNQYQGVLTTAPTARTDGTPLQDGDRYFNDTIKASYVYRNGNWTPEIQFSLTTEVITIDQNTHVNGGGTTITLANAYTPNNNAIFVFVGPAFQFSQNVDPAGAYVETDETTIDFPGVYLEDGEMVTVMGVISQSSLEITVQCKSGMYVVETTGQTVIPLPDGLVYTPNNNNLTVSVNGYDQFPGYHYTESSTSAITMYSPLTEGDVVIFRFGEMLSNVAETDVITKPLLTSMMNTTLDTTKTILVKGGYTAGDGSGGLYTWDVSCDKALANGVTIIDADKTLVNQGTGTTNGCWIRQYEDEISPRWWNKPEKGATVLRYLTAVDGDSVNLKGMLEDTVRGGGFFYWDGSEPRASHNGVTVISPRSNETVGATAWYTAPVAGAAGCWIRQITSAVSIDWFGITGDGVADDTDAFTEASTWGSPVYVPPGSYAVTGAIVGNFYTFGTVTIVGGTVTVSDIFPA